MAKRNNKKNQNQQSGRCSLHDCEIRPVTKKDKWCIKRVPRGGILEGEAPFGYIITIPYLPKDNTFLKDINGYIVRSRKFRRTLLLQVIIKKEEIPEYGIKSFARNEPNAKEKRKLHRIFNVRNLNKYDGRW